MKNFYLLSALLILQFMGSLRAQTIDFAHIDNTSGLSNNQVECVFKDSKGFLWIGTNFGLNRYDGYHFTIYKAIKGDTCSLLYNSTSEIEEDGGGNLWIKGEKYVVYDSENELIHQNLSSILCKYKVPNNPNLVKINNKKDIYFYYYNQGLYKYDSRSKITLHLNGILTSPILQLFCTQDACWILYESGRIQCMNENTNQIIWDNNYVQNNMNESTIEKHLFVDSRNDLWVYPGINDRGVLHYSQNQKLWKQLCKDDTHVKILSDFIRDVDEDLEGNIWLATDHGGISIINHKTQNITNLLHYSQKPYSISQNSVISLYRDQSGTMWTGTYKNGISYYNSQMFKFKKSALYFLQDSLLETKDCNVFCKDSKGLLWIGTNGEGLICYNSQNNKFKIYTNNPRDVNSLSSNIVISLMEDHQGRLWIGTFLGGLNCFDGKRFIRYPTNTGNKHTLSNKSIYGLVEDIHKNIWIGTLGGGVNCLDSTRKYFDILSTETHPNMSSNFILSMSPTDSQTIYLSTSKGLDVLDVQTKSISSLFNAQQLDSLSDKIIYSSLADSKHRIWLASDNGIDIYNTHTHHFSHLNQRVGLPSDQVVSLQEDKQGNVWVGTRNGLACISPIHTSTQEQFSIRSFSQEDGLPSNICNQNALYTDSEGAIYVGTSKGYTHFKPQEIQVNNTIPQPQFTGFVMNATKTKVIDGETLNLHYNENSFSIQFSALNYIHPNKNMYKYQLKGFNNEWKYLRNGTNSVSYSNLNSGTYTFRVYASNNDGVWSTHPLLLEIHIQPPFWLSIWFLILYFLLAVFLIRLLIKIKLNKQQSEFNHKQQIFEAQRTHEMDEMKFKFFTNISHEFRTPLTLIINPIEKLIHQQPSEQDQKLLEIILKNAKGLLDLVTQLLDFRKLDLSKDTLNLSVGDVIEFLRDICYSFSDLANKKNINFSFTSSVTALRMEFDSEKLKKIIINLLSNAFKFTHEGGKIDVKIDMDTDQLVVSVIDTGVGISEKHLPHIFERFYRIENHNEEMLAGTGVGLHLVSEYTQLLQGSIAVTSKEGEGSLFVLKVPILKQTTKEWIYKPALLQPTDSIANTNLSSVPHAKNQPLLLIVDDNEDFRSFATTLFDKTFHVITANDGIEAYDMILERLPDFIISDVMMPLMDGYELCKKIKSDIRTSHIPIILLTAKASEDNKYLGIQAGADDYIAKPFNIDLLILKVNRLIEQQKSIHEKFKTKLIIPTSEVEIISMDEMFVQRAVSIAESHLEDANFLVEDLCKEMGMSRVYFYKKILSLTAKSPSRFIRFIRIRRAADLLQKSNYFVNEVAYKVGFNDPKNFSKYFKEEFGVLPSDFKKNNSI